nr:hypothetical protein [uncultured Carboxylicivirga sp.]
MKSRFSKQLDLDESQAKILESLRFQDEDLSAKLGSILAFSGLMIATSIVQLSTSEDSIIHVDNEKFFLLLLNSLGLLILFSSAIITIIGFILSGKYSNDTDRALIEFDNYLNCKRKLLKFAVILLLIGTTAILTSLIVVLISRIIC